MAGVNFRRYGKPKNRPGNDGGCFAAALAAVRRWGGVLEHPEASHAFAAHGLNKPPKSGGWIPAGDFRGWVACVEQGHYGHRARKATWLYFVRDWPAPPELPITWGPSAGERLDEGFHSREERNAARAAGRAPRKRLSTAENLRTPVAFRDLLLSIARSAISPEPMHWVPVGDGDADAVPAPATPEGPLPTATKGPTT